MVGCFDAGHRRQQLEQQQRRPTLLQKLLARDIRAEHSRLLQCFRFIVTNNFLLDYGSTPLHFPPEPTGIDDGLSLPGMSLLAAP
jgi:hypothetical protein